MDELWRCVLAGYWGCKVHDWVPCDGCCHGVVVVVVVEGKGAGGGEERGRPNGGVDGLRGRARHFPADDADVFADDEVVVVDADRIVGADGADAPKVELVEAEHPNVVAGVVVDSGACAAIIGGGGGGVPAEVEVGQPLDDAVVKVPVESNVLPRDKGVDPVGNGAEKVVVVLGDRRLKEVEGGWRGGHGAPHAPKAVPHPGAQPAVVCGGGGVGGGVDAAAAPVDVAHYSPGACCRDGWGPEGEVVAVADGG